MKIRDKKSVQNPSVWRPDLNSYSYSKDTFRKGRDITQRYTDYIKTIKH